MGLGFCMGSQSIHPDASVKDKHKHLRPDDCFNSPRHCPENKRDDARASLNMQLDNG